MRRGTVFWGTALILLGALLLLNSLGAFDPLLESLGIERISILGLVGSLFLVGLGVWILWRLFAGPRSAGVPVEEIAVPLESATEGRVRIRHGAGILRIDASAGPDHVRTPGSCTVHLTCPLVRVTAISRPAVSTRKTLSPAIHGACEPGTFIDHSRSPVACWVAIIRPAWPTA